MKKMLVWAGVALCMVCPAIAQEDEIVLSTGIASSYRGAINEALATALERHDGVTISFEERSKAAESFDAVSTRTNGLLDEQAKTKLNDSISKEMGRWAKGRIKGYDVLSDRFENGRYRVEVSVRFAAKREVGLPEGNRRRMAVVGFRSESGAGFTWRNTRSSSAAWASSLAQRFVERLTQTRKFTMLDRKFDDEIGVELARLTDANASSDDIGLLGRKLGTDYLVVGSVRFFDSGSPTRNPLTGKEISATGPFCEVSYRVLLASTGQVKWSDTVTVDVSEIQASEIGAFASASADLAAMRAVDGMMANILPFEVVGRNAAGEILVGEGGKSLAVGEIFTVFALGEDVYDSRTGEVLDQIETDVGDVEIVRVGAKMSYARIVRGDGAAMATGSRLRRKEPTKADLPPPPATTVFGSSTGGVITPF